MKTHFLPDSGQQPDDDDDDEEDDEDYNVIADILNVEDWDETRQDKTTMIPRHEVKALMMDTLLAEREIPINVIPDDVMIIGEDHRQKTQKSQRRGSLRTA
uniref:Uncharacterized protein n=1 Tax=Caenorhabditis japonica TaxID=281687 RepID=A0A8R1ECJ2_CAEJA